jgi:hypothetical protein
MKSRNNRLRNNKNRNENKLTKYRRNSEYKKKICSPKNNNNFTCFTKKSLIKMLTSWNDYYSNDKIQFSETDKLFSLWSKLDTKLKHICTDEYCWTKQQFVTKDRELKEEFRPEMPNKWQKNKNEWLTTLDIEAVMKQYEKKYDDFVFIGPVPIDFDKELHPGFCVIDELCNINLKKILNKGKKKIGVIFNLDPHDKPGSHWVSMFADFDKENNVYYFDSYGYKEPKEVTALMNRLKTQAEELNKTTNLYTNDIRHQFKNSECGIYSIHFILKLLEGESFENITKNIIKDDEMEQNRDELFIKYF